MQLIKYYPAAQVPHFQETTNWRANNINDSLYYSFRSTDYDRNTFPAHLHYHEYFELLFFVEGSIRYICEQDAWRPQSGDIILIPPHHLHMSMIDGDATHYTRHVFYLFPDAFDTWKSGVLADFLNRKDGAHFVIHPSPADVERLFHLLESLDQALSRPEDALENVHAIALVLRLFYWLNRGAYTQSEPEALLPPKIREIQRWMDENFAAIESIDEIAHHFFYSREYLSRQFKRWFNTTPADYITKRRVVCAQKLLIQGKNLQEACCQAGFNSMATFIRAFRKTTGTTPAAYRAGCLQQE